MNDQVNENQDLATVTDESPRPAQASPRCPKCGFVMCEQFDTQRINERAELATPNGTYVCYGCNTSTAWRVE